MGFAVAKTVAKNAGKDFSDPALASDLLQFFKEFFPLEDLHVKSNVRLIWNKHVVFFSLLYVATRCMYCVCHMLLFVPRV